jgi:hypothetical protein
MLFAHIAASNPADFQDPHVTAMQNRSHKKRGKLSLLMTNHLKPKQPMPPDIRCRGAFKGY